MGFLRRECGSGLSRQTGIVQKGNSSSGQHFIGDCHDLQQILGREIDLSGEPLGLNISLCAYDHQRCSHFEQGNKIILECNTLLIRTDKRLSVFQDLTVRGFEYSRESLFENIEPQKNPSQSFF